MGISAAITSYQKRSEILAGSFAFCLPLFPKLLPLCAALLLINSISGNFTGFLWRIPRGAMFWLTVLYVIYLAGMLATRNKASGWFDLEIKLSFILFPFIFTNFLYTEKTLRNISGAFIAGILAAGVYCMVQSIRLYYANNHDPYYLFYNFFSVIIHSTYYSLYLNLAIIIAAFALIEKMESGIRTWLPKALLLPPLVLFNVLCASKAGTLTMCFFLMVFYFYFFYRIKKLIAGTLICIGLLTLSGLFLKPLIKPVMVRFREMLEMLSNTQLISDKKSQDSSTLRVHIWQGCAGIIAKNPITGVGTGDVKDELLLMYQREGITVALEKKLNAHNQFIQTTIAAGLTGLAVLIILFVSLFRTAIENKDRMALLLSCLLAFNLLFESMFETQAGVLFIAFFICLWYKPGQPVNFFQKGK